jgi:hypothetical protein
MREGRGVWWENVRERDHWGDPGLYGRIIKPRMLKFSHV